VTRCVSSRCKGWRRCGASSEAVLPARNIGEPGYLVAWEMQPPIIRANGAAGRSAPGLPRVCGPPSSVQTVLGQSQSSPALRLPSEPRSANVGASSANTRGGERAELRPEHFMTGVVRGALFRRVGVTIHELILLLVDDEHLPAEIDDLSVDVQLLLRRLWG
jgi:hypothetical protein